jgi:uncharacterized protein (TIGR02145 family)
MKRLLFVLVMLLMTTMVTAQKISYQAVVRDSHNRLVVNTNVTVVVTITHGAGTYTESLNGTTNANGLMSLEIGGASGFDAIDWRHAQIKTLVLLPGGETVEDVVQVTAVPIALYANYAADVSPSAPAITAIYSDMAALGTRIADDSLVLANRITALNAHLNDTLGNYYNTTQVKTAIHDTADAIRAAIPASQVNADWEATSGPAEILNKPTIPTTVAELTDAANYTTNAHLNDTLSHYYNDVKVNDTLSNYYNATQVKTAIHDTADAIRAAIPASQVNADWEATSGPAEILNKPTIPTTVAELSDAANYATNAHLNDTLSHYYNDVKVNDTLSNYYNATQVKTAIHDTADAIRAAIPASQVNADWEATSGAAEILNKPTIPTTVAELSDAANYTTNAHLNDTLSHYYNDVKVNDTLSNYYNATQVKTAIHDTADAIRAAIPASQVNADWTATSGAAEILNKPTIPTTVAELTDAANYTTNAHLNDTLSHYYDTTQVKTAIHDTANAIRAAIPVQVNADWTATSGAAEILNKPTIPTTVAELSDAANYTTNAHLNDTLSHYYDTTQVKTAIHDTANAIRAAIPAQVNADWEATSGPAEILRKPTIPTTVAELTDAANYATNAHLNDTLSHYYDTTQVKTAIHDTANAIRAAIPAQVNADWEATSGPAEILRKPTIPTTVAELTDAANYATNAHLNDTLSHYYDTTQVKTAIHDTANVLRGEFPVVNDARITIALIRGTESGVTNPTFGVNQDTNQTVTINIPEAATVNNGQLTIIAAGDTTRFTANQATNDTMRLNKFATKDTLKNFVNKLAIRDSVNNIVKDSLAAPNSAINMAIDTIARHNISDSTRMVFDTLHKYYATKDTLKNFVNKLAIRDSVNNIVKDSLAAPNSAINMAIDTIARHNISDSTRMVFDTLHYYYTTNAHLNDTLKHYTTSKQIDTLLGAYATKVALRDSTKMVYDTLHKYYATKDTLKNFVRTDALCAEVMNCIDIRHMRDSIQKVNNRLTYDSTKLAERIHDDSLVLAQKIRKDSIVVMDTLHSYYATKKALKDTAAAIRALIPTIPNDIAITTADNQFTGTNTVPSGFNIKTTNNTNCNDVVVNACDLWAVFDSLNRRITALENAAPPVFNSISLTNPTIETMDVTADFTSEYIPITGYQFCYSQNSDMSESTCVPSTTNSITLTGLSSYTDYYVTASATNKEGTTTSAPVATKRTLAHEPMAVIQPSPLSPFGITVTVTGLDFMEPGEGTVQLFYVERTSSTCSTNIDDYTPLPVSSILHTGDSYIENIEGLGKNKNYCIIAKVSNVDNTTTIGPINATSGGSDELLITCDYYEYFPNMSSVGSFYACMPDYTLTVQFVCNPKYGNADDYENYVWTLKKCSKSALPSYSSKVDSANTCTITFGDNNNKYFNLTCTARRKGTNDEIYGETGENAKRVRTAGGRINRPTLNESSFCVDELAVTIKSSYSLVKWGDGTIEFNPPANTTHIYDSAGSYTIKVVNTNVTDGDRTRACDATQTVTVISSTTSTTTSCTGTPHQSTEYNTYGLTSKDGYEEGSEGAITSVTDFDGNVYPVVEINGQCWMKENLRCTHSPTSGNSILNINGLSGDNYFMTTTGKSAHWYQNNSEKYEPKHFGLLYNWCAAMDYFKDDEFNTSTESWNPSHYDYLYEPHHRGICPRGWHIPTSDEWTVLAQNGDASLVKGCEWGTGFGTCATCASNFSTERNTTGFSALPTHFYTVASSGYASAYQSGAGFWVTNNQNRQYRCFNSSGGFYTDTQHPQDLVSIRCVRDTASTPSAIPHEPGAIYLSVDNDHPSVQLCSSNGQNYPYASYHPVTVTYTAILSSDDPIADLTGYTITWSVSPATLNPTIDEENRTCTVIYSSYPHYGTPHPYITCRATKEGEPDKVVSFSQSFSTPSNRIPTSNVFVDTLTVMLRSNSNAIGIESNYTINWGDGSAAQVGPASTITTGPDHTYSAPGLYTITLTNGSGCSATKEVTLTTAARFPCAGTAHQGAEYQNNGLNGTKNDGYEYTNGEGIVSVTDYDGNIYSVVQIGNQCWTRENMRCTHSPLTGTSIVNPLGASGNTFTMSKTSKVAQWYLNDQETSISKRYGLYYNWCAAMDVYSGNEVPQQGQSESYWSFSVTGDRRGICPKGWHIPSQSEFNELVSAAGSGTALAGSCDWNYCFGNEKDFYAVPAGEATLQFMNSGAISNGTIYANFWSTKENTNERVYPLRLTNPSAGESGYTSVSASTTYNTYYKDYGASVRCVRNSE